MVRRFLNFLLWISICVLSGTGSALAWRFPSGPRRGTAYTLLGMDVHFWKDVHLWIGILFALLVILHMYMAWPWLKSAAAGRKRLWAVLLGIFAGLSIPAILWLSPVQSRGGISKQTEDSAQMISPTKGEGQGERQGRGQMRARRKSD